MYLEEKIRQKNNVAAALNFEIQAQEYIHFVLNWTELFSNILILLLFGQYKRS